MKGRPTPKREEQRRRRRAEARAARERDPNLMRLYEAFSPPARSKVRR